jgi:hypothetical protein
LRQVRELALSVFTKRKPKHKETEVKKLAPSKWFLSLLVMLTLRAAAVAQEIQISTVEELYSAVNDSANARATLVLAPGIYMLSTTDPKGATRPKGGRIELQPDMSLVGVDGDRSLVVIDAVNLPKGSGTTGPIAAVRMGLGHNSLEWLTVRDAVNAQANIDTRLQLQPSDPGTAYILLAHIASTGGVRGLNLFNYGLQASNRIIEADIIDSYFFDNTSSVSEGIRIGNFAGAQKSTINLRMSGNLSWGQQTGRVIENSGTLDTVINVLDSGNRFYSNGTGTIIFAGVAGGLGAAFPRTDGNTINFEAHGDQFIGNIGFSAIDHGGLLVRGTENVTPNNTTGGGSNNTVNIALWGCRMLDNTQSDLYAVGARSQFASTAPFTQNNHITIEIHGDGNGNGRWQPVEFVTDSLPALPDEGNSVTVID